METMTVRQSWSDGRIDGLEHKVDEGFRHVDQRFEQVDKRFDRVEAQLELLHGDMRSFHRILYMFCFGMLGIFGALVGTLLTITLTQL